MADLTLTLSPWGWLALGVVLLVLETLGAAGYLLWMGVAAGSVGLVLFVAPGLAVTVQLILFGVLAVLSAVFCWSRQKRDKKPVEQPLLNQRATQLVGQTFTLCAAIQDGRGKIQVGDSLWTVTGPDLPVGTRVRVIDHEGLVLHTEPVSE